MLLLILVGYQTVIWVSTFTTRIILDIFKIAVSIPIKNIFLVIAITGQRNVSILHMSALYATKRRLMLANSCWDDENCSVDKIKKLLVIHDKLCDAVTILNKCITLNILLSILKVLMFSTLLLFGIYDCIWNDESLKNKMFLLTGFATFLPEAIFITIVTTLSTLLKSEVGKMFSVIQNKCSSCNSESIKLLKIAVLHLEARVPTISCEIFAIDCRFVFLIISACFSCTIILLQFDIVEHFLD